jgi:1-acyl-sn-glycerol-3-phosphate acyltransferase
MKKLLLGPYQLWVWLVFIPYVAVSTLIFALLALVLILVGSQRLASRVAGVLWSRLICFMTPVFVTVRGRENIDRSQSYVIVANHQSVYDIVVLYGWLGVDFRWVMKQELRKVPFLGVACEKIGHIFIDRSNTKRAMESLEAAGQVIADGTSVIFFPEGTRSETGRLGKFKVGAFKMVSLNAAKQIITNGTSVIFFPEGTRSETGELGKFKMGAFKMAADLSLPILPVTIAGTRDIVRTKSLLLFPGRAELRVHPPISTAGQSPADLLKQTRALMAEALGAESV